MWIEASNSSHARPDASAVLRAVRMAWLSSLGLAMLAPCLTACGRDGPTFAETDSVGTDDGADTTANTSATTADTSATATTATTSNDDWGDEGDDDWGDDGTDDGTVDTCDYNEVWAYMWVDTIVGPSPSNEQTLLCEVDSVFYEDFGQSYMDVQLGCRDDFGGFVQTFMYVEASPGFDQFIFNGDRLRIRVGYQSGGFEYGNFISIERQGEGRIASYVEGTMLQGDVGPDPAIPFLRGTEPLTCFPSDWQGCGETTAERLVFDTPGGVVSVDHQEAVFDAGPGDLNVWVGNAVRFAEPEFCGQPAVYNVFAARY